MCVLVGVGSQPSTSRMTRGKWSARASARSAIAIIWATATMTAANVVAWSNYIRHFSVLKIKLGASNLLHRRLFLFMLIWSDASRFHRFVDVVFVVVNDDEKQSNTNWFPLSIDPWSDSNSIQQQTTCITNAFRFKLFMVYNSLRTVCAAIYE